ncbi:MAG: hypothetical protein U9N57_10440 [Pseudomonadota bacterium]|nr:hypothetical protein [Pseudomonadota bacterium]
MGKLIKIFGERNTNTNYLSQLIELNLSCEELRGGAPIWILRAQNKLSINETLEDLYFGLFYFRNYGWKHRAIEEGFVPKKGINFVTITKNPYSWLLSLYRNPYNKGAVDAVSFEEFLTSPWVTFDREGCEKLVKNPIELWNVKNNSYKNLPQDQILRITTEGLFEDPEKIIKDIATHFNIPFKNELFQNYERSTKDKSKDSAYYKDFYLNERWREKLTPIEISIINEFVDRSLMEFFGYQVIV